MMRHLKRLGLWITLAVAGPACLAQKTAVNEALKWQPWSQDVFTQAKQQHKFVLLDLEAVWCHWCHVMDAETYSNPAVIKLLNDKYLLIRVDQDARPDISNRYQDYGWPATVVFAADGSEIVKRQGYIEPKQMASMLRAIIKDPSPGPSIERETRLQTAADATISPALLAVVKKNFEAQYDKQEAGWAFGHKYLDVDSYLLGLRFAAAGDATYKQRMALSLKQGQALIDPAWGGAYQYSVDGVWNEPHFEKLIFIQDSYLRAYALAYGQTHDASLLATAQAVHKYVRRFLTDEATGAVFVSQDADLHDDGTENAPYFALNDAGRMAQGVPRVDKHVYARENGWTIQALAEMYAVSGDASALKDARRAADWIVMHRSLPGGGYRHDDRDPAGPYLADTLSMGQAFLTLYLVDGDRRDLDRAQGAASFIAGHFKPLAAGTGFITSATATDTAFKPHADREENVALVQFASLLSAANGNDGDRKLAEEAMRYLAAPSVAKQWLSAGTLLAHDDLQTAPLHVTILGGKNDAAAMGLHTAALRAFTQHEVIEWRDPSDPHPLPTSVQYPQLPRAAMFLCTATSCSSPVFDPAQVAARVAHAQLPQQH
ncbi:DUF255 domain-containing protein [Granulicella paludicola]|uniref:DUF255 domain-containing protein n=1 Tax=Granulicella paludicola TaxID=474951 RepID=UPI0021DFEEAE|nr:DUF255 domain-containing protein [Granulicella paludicola]